MKSRTWAVLLGLVVLLLLIIQPGEGPERVEVGVTSELVGRWTAFGPRHADRFLEIRATEITFGQGVEGAVSHRLRGVFLEAARDGAPLYVLAYDADDGTTDAPLELRVRVKDGRLRIANLNDVSWRRLP